MEFLRVICCRTLAAGARAYARFWLGDTDSQPSRHGLYRRLGNHRLACSGKAALS